MEFKEFTNPEEKDYDITSSFSKTERAKKTSRENKISQIFTESLGNLGFPELYELAHYGITDEEYTHPSLDTIKKLEEYKKYCKSLWNSNKSNLAIFFSNKIKNSTPEEQKQTFNNTMIEYINMIKNIYRFIDKNNKLK